MVTKVALLIRIPRQDVGLVEVNEAFTPQCLAVAKELNIDMNKCAGYAYSSLIME